MKKLTILLLSLFLSGCVTLNSNPRYTPSYIQDVDNVWSTIKKLPLKNNYTYLICSAKETTQPNMPEIKGTRVFLPQVFIDYVYQNYYNNRNEIFTCLFLHEISHTEYNLPASPPETHYQVDMKALDLFFPPNFANEDYEKTATIFYSFLQVLQNYNEARKGVEKHLFNIVWNTVNAATYAYVGVGSFGDWFTYDITQRLRLFKSARPYVKFIFKRSSFSKND